MGVPLCLAARDGAKRFQTRNLPHISGPPDVPVEVFQRDSSDHAKEQAGDSAEQERQVPPLREGRHHAGRSNRGGAVDGRNGRFLRPKQQELELPLKGDQVLGAGRAALNLRQAVAETCQAGSGALDALAEEREILGAGNRVSLRKLQDHGGSVAHCPRGDLEPDADFADRISGVIHRGGSVNVLDENSDCGGTLADPGQCVPGGGGQLQGAKAIGEAAKPAFQAEELSHVGAGHIELPDVSQLIGCRRQRVGAGRDLVGHQPPRFLARLPG